MLKIIILLLTTTTAALAQPQPQPAAQPPQQSAEQQALANKLMQEMSSSLQCQSALITAQREIEELKKKERDGAPAK